MARPLRIAFAGALYHVICRGNSRQNIFYSDDDRLHFLRVLNQTVSRFGWVCYAYCLMSNHFHLLIKTLEPSISTGMHFLNGTFTQHFNWTHQRVGHLFQGRFKSPLVQESTYFQRLCRYIVMNPVKAGICTNPGDYRWSSFNATVGRAPVPDFLSVEPVLRQWNPDPTQARRRYEQFVLEGSTDDPFAELKNQLYFGDDAFLEQLKPLIPANISPDVILDQRLLLRPTLEQVFQQSEGLRMARETHGFSMREIAEHLNVSRTALYRQMNKRR